MEVTKRCYHDKVVDILCDKCGESTLEPSSGNTVEATLVFQGCYGADHDFQRHTAHLCEKCAFEIFDSLPAHKVERLMF